MFCDARKDSVMQKTSKAKPRPPTMSKSPKAKAGPTAMQKKHLHPTFLSDGFNSLTLCTNFHFFLIPVKPLFHRHGTLFFNPSFVVAFY